MRRFSSIGYVLLLSACAAYGQQEVRIGVLRLFHPKEVVVAPVAGSVLNCAAGEDRWAVQGPQRVRIESTAVRVVNASNGLVPNLACDDGQGSAADFVVAVPAKLSRHYHGVLEMSPQAGELLLVVKMELETAVASIVAAESPPHAPLEALKAQAVAARSFLIAGKGRHGGFDFCDTTHCQFLREPPPAGSPSAEAAAATRGLVLAYKGQSFAAMYSASCGGRTHSLEELGLATSGYPYFAVDCDYCHRHPEKWVTRLSQAEAASLKQTEESRLRLARRLGWKTVPGNSYSSRAENGEVILEGTGVGHGIGLCQRGAAEMARQGSSFQQILEHYYPNTELRQY
jgi:stage II sporulation protein D (peptidoglycan lytic transglycosylase)